MLAVFDLHKAMTESVSGSHHSSYVEAYEFNSDTLQECVSEGSYIALSECAALAHFGMVSEELMVESALSGDASRLEALSEGVFSTIIEKAKKIIDKIRSIVKSLIEKIKAFYLRVRGKTTAWCTAMEEHIKKAVGAAGAADKSFEFHKWDTKFVLNTMPDSLVAGYADEGKANSVGTAQAGVKLQTVQTIIRKAEKLKVGTQDNAIKAVVDELKTATDAADKSNEKIEDDIINVFATSLNVTTATTKDLLIKGIRQKATNSSEKVSQKVYGQAMDMLTFVKGSSDAIRKNGDAYKKFEDILGKYKSALEEKQDFAVKSVNDEGGTIPSEVMTAGSSLLSSYIKGLSDTASKKLTIGGVVHNANTSYINEINKEYMSVLSKFAGRTVIPHSGK